jgi:hypothetical protein
MHSHLQGSSKRILQGKSWTFIQISEIILKHKCLLKY